MNKTIKYTPYMWYAYYIKFELEISDLGIFRVLFLSGESTMLIYLIPIVQ